MAEFLTGVWRIERRIADRLAGTDGRLVGTAWFHPEPGGLRCAETGMLTFGGYHGRASRTTWFELLRPDAAEVRFEDGRPFHHLDLSSGTAEISHACPPDAYRGRWRVSGRDRWTVAWLVDGPRKRLRIASRYVRVAGDPG